MVTLLAQGHDGRSREIREDRARSHTPDSEHKVWRVKTLWDVGPARCPHVDCLCCQASLNGRAGLSTPHTASTLLISDKGLLCRREGRCGGGPERQHQVGRAWLGFVSLGSQRKHG